MLNHSLSFLMSSGILNYPYLNSRFEKDYFRTSKGVLEIFFIGHGTLIFTFQDKVIHVDPFGKVADYQLLPKADIILLTHEHDDHMDLQVIDFIKEKHTALVLTERCSENIGDGLVMKNGDIKTVKGILIQAVPAYNIQYKRENGQPFHPSGVGNGYIIHFGELRVYLAGDTENIPEMKEIENIDIAFLPMNLPYTMTPEMVADAAKKFKPKVLYPYHFGDTNTGELINLLKDEKDMEVRIRKMS